MFNFEEKKLNNIMSTIEFNEALVGLENHLQTFAMSFTRNRDDARDLTQETILKAITYRKHYAPQTNFKAWVFTIMRNIFINQYRRKVKSRTIFDTSADNFLAYNSKSLENSAISQICQQEIRKEISNLDKEFKDSFELHCRGFKYKEIAEELGVPIGTVKSRIFMARKKLMDALPEYRFN